MKSFNSFRLSDATTIQSITAQARRAAAISVAERKCKKEGRSDEKPKKKPCKQETPLEQATRAIRTAIAANIAPGISLVNEKPGPFSSAHAIISLYRDADIEAHREAQERKKSDPTVKVPKLIPVIKYVLFAAVLDSKHLGSVAIYCENVVSRQAMIADAGHLFGIPVKSATLESGICQYVDVVLRA